MPMIDTLEEEYNNFINSKQTLASLPFHLGIRMLFNIVNWFSILAPPDKVLTLQGFDKRESSPKADAN